MHLFLLPLYSYWFRNKAEKWTFKLHLFRKVFKNNLARGRNGNVNLWGDTNLILKAISVDNDINFDSSL